MPDHSFPAAKPPKGFYSVTQTFVGVEQKSSFPSFIEPIQEPWRTATLRARQADVSALLRPLTFHAEPLAPLRQRDEQALEDMFDDDKIEDIVSDICIRLKQLCPEPCWEDDSFDFLKGYI